MGVSRTMLPGKVLPRGVLPAGIQGIWICLLLAGESGFALDLQSLGLRARVSEKTVLGNGKPENFQAYDLAAGIRLPWERYSESGWGMGTRLMLSTGLLHGAARGALTLSAVPELTFGSKDGRLLLDMGAGGALFTRHRFGTQDYGAPFQFALTVGGSVPLNKNLGLGYRYLHYSDAGIWGGHTIGADFHMVEVQYRCN